MYQIYADGVLIHDMRLEDSTRTALDPFLTVELNEPGSLEFTMLPDHIMYNAMVKMKTIVRVLDGEKSIFKGRVVSDERDFNNNKSVTCEGMYAFFNDTIVRPHDKTMPLTNYIQWLVTNHNSQVEDAKKFYMGNVTVNDAWAELKFSSEDYVSTADMFIELADTYDGYFTTQEIDGHNYLNFLSDSNTDSAQTISFGENLLDLRKTISGEDLFTVVIPIGGVPDNSKDDKNITIKSVNDDKDYLELSASVGTYGRIVRYKDWNDITDPHKLLQTAQAYLRDNAGLDVTLEVSAVDLSLIYPNYKSIAVGERVKITSKPHDVDEYFICTKIEMDMLDPSNTIYNFGTMNKKLLSEKVSKTNNTLQQQINNVNTEVHNNYTTGQSTYVHQDELNDAISRLTNSDIDSICAS